MIDYGDYGSYTITTTFGSSECNHEYIEDGYCDDGNNHIVCSFDGGDCCGPNINLDYCSECICLEEEYFETTTLLGSSEGTTFLVTS